ncbi:MAG: hypothetical protein ACOYT4_04655 [Nanoarchaeota archaeon]
MQVTRTFDLTKEPFPPKILEMKSFPDEKSRIYVHAFGIEIFDGKTGRDKIKNAMEYAEHIQKSEDFRNLIDYCNLGYAIGIVWADRMKMIDWFCYYNIDWWPGNPEMQGYTTKADKTLKGMSPCADGMIISGLEEVYRRRTKDLKEFLEKAMILKSK